MICPYCNNDVATIADKSLNRCAECKVELHRDFVQKTNIPYVSIGLIGHVNHGKTAFLTALFCLLKHMPSKWPGFYFNALDDYSLGFYDKVATFETSGTLEGNTGYNFSTPALFKFANIPTIGDCFISFYDVAGETYSEQAKITARGRSVAQSDIAIFLIDITDWETQWEYELQKMLDTYVNATQHRMQIDLKKQDLIVTLTKGDLLASKISDELWGYLSSGTVDKYEKLTSNGKPGSNGLIRNIFTKQAGGFVNMAEKHFKSVSYAIVSSTGAKTADAVSIAPIVLSDPKRVLDPFVQLIYLVNSDRQRFLKRRAVKARVLETTSNTTGQKNPVPPPINFSKLFAGGIGGALLLISIGIVFTLVSKNGSNSGASSTNTSSNSAPAPAPAPEQQRANPPADVPQPEKTEEDDSPQALFEKGLALFESDSSKAVQLFKNAAERGYVKAQRKLGGLYYGGKGVSQDYAEAANWYKKAAENGDADSQYFYSYLLNKGEGVSINEAEGMKWLRRAAKKGHLKAKETLHDYLERRQ